MNKLSKWLSAIVVGVLLFTVFFASTKNVQAYELDDDGKVSSDEIINDDLILGGDNVVMNGKVVGNLIASGQDVAINGFVEGDVFAFGQTVTIGQGAKITGNLFTGAQIVVISGKVTGSVFSGSMSTSIKSSAQIDRNVYFGGYSLDIAKDAVIKKDLAAGGYQVILDGEVTRDVNADVGAFQLNGTVGRNFNVSVGEPGTGSSSPSSAPFMSQYNVPATLETGLLIAESAKIGGDLNYTSVVPQNSAIQAEPSGSVTYMTPVPSNEDQQVDRTTPQYRVKNFFEAGIGKAVLDTARRFISIFLMGALALWLVPGTVKALTDIIRGKTLPSVGYGALVYLVGWTGSFVAFLVLIAVAVLLGIITLGGLGAITFWSGTTVLIAFITVFVLMISFGSQVLVASLVGNWVVQKITHQQDANRFIALLVGVIIYVLLRAIPILGWLISIVVVAAGLGAAWLYSRSLRKAAPQVVTA